MKVHWKTEELIYKKLSFAVFISILILWMPPFLFGKYVDLSFPFVHEDDIPSELEGFLGTSATELCPAVSPALKGTDYEIHETLRQMRFGNQMTRMDTSGIEPGGVWRPTQCQARYEIVIIVPFRNRSKQLETFINYMHPFLQRQLLHYRIFVIEQDDGEMFNRARLFNIGFEETFRLGSKSDCFIFHDVDLIPLNDLNIYACTHRPRHLYSALDIFRYHLPYRSLFGGAIAILSSHFREVNGFSNRFGGWGGEDDDFSRRLSQKGLEFMRFDPRVARYVMMPHIKHSPALDRWHNLDLSSINTSTNDGLSTLNYKLVNLEVFPLYIHIKVK